MSILQASAPRKIVIDHIVSIDELHTFYHQLVAKLAIASNCQVHLLDDLFSPRLQYFSTTRGQMDLFIREILRLDCYFALKLQTGKEKFYDKDKFSFEGIELDDVNSIRIYKRLYAKNNHLVHGAHSALVVDFWRKQEEVYTANEFNVTANNISADLLKQSLVTIDIDGEPVSVFAAYAKERERVLNDPIDIVYTWVNSDDESWQQRKLKRLATHEQADKVQSHSNDKVRFLDNNELLYSLRSVTTYMKGIRKIFIVTDDQTPEFLSENSKFIQVIDHEEIFKDPSHLPTYNSHAIGSQLHRIPHLSNKYLYFNDDIMVGKALTRQTFFDEYDRAKCFFSSRVSIPASTVSEYYSSVDNAAINNRQVIDKHFGRNTTRKFKHTPIAALKDVMQCIEDKFPEAFEITTANPLRSQNDFSLAGSFYFHYGLNIGRVYPASISYRYLNLSTPGFNTAIAGVSSQKEATRPDIFCVNSSMDSDIYPVNARTFNKVMQQIYPLKGKYEKSDD